MKITAIIDESFDKDRAIAWVSKIEGSILKPDSGESAWTNVLFQKQYKVYISATAERLIEILSEMRDEGFFS